MFTIFLAATLSNADEAVMGMGLENLLIDRELAYEGPMGSELAELDHLRVQISLWFVESELTKVSELSAAWWARPQADDAAWHPINTDPACDSVSSEVHQALSRVRFGGSLMDAVRLGSHPSCSLILGTSTCATLFEAGRCARDAVAARTGDNEPGVSAPESRTPTFGVSEQTIRELTEVSWALEELPEKHVVRRHRAAWRSVALDLDAQLAEMAESREPVSAGAWCDLQHERLRLAFVEPFAITDVRADEQDRGVMFRSFQGLAASASGCERQKRELETWLGAGSLDSLWQFENELAPVRVGLEPGMVAIDGVWAQSDRVDLRPGTHLVQRFSENGVRTALLDVQPGDQLTIGLVDDEIAFLPPEPMD